MSITFINTFTAKKGKEKNFTELAKGWSQNLDQMPEGVFLEMV